VACGGDLLLAVDAWPWVPERMGVRAKAPSPRQRRRSSVSLSTTKPPTGSGSSNSSSSNATAVGQSTGSTGSGAGVASTLTLRALYWKAVVFHVSTEVHVAKACLAAPPVRHAGGRTETAQRAQGDPLKRLPWLRHVCAAAAEEVAAFTGDESGGVAVAGPSLWMPAVVNSGGSCSDGGADSTPGAPMGSDVSGGGGGGGGGGGDGGAEQEQKGCHDGADQVCSGPGGARGGWVNLCNGIHVDDLGVLLQSSHESYVVVASLSSLSIVVIRRESLPFMCCVFSYVRVVWCCWCDGCATQPCVCVGVVSFEKQFLAEVATAVVRERRARKAARERLIDNMLAAIS